MSYRIYINHTKCTACGICIDLCEKGVYAFDREGRIYVKNEVLCVGCRTCVERCPYNALTIRGLDEF